MKPYYQDDWVTIYHGDCREVLPDIEGGVYVTDPPYGIGFSGYGLHDDKPGRAYIELVSVISDKPRVVLQYIEETARYLVPLWGPMDEVFLWIYNSNTARQSRSFSFWGVDVDFKRVKQQSKNPTDPRVSEMVAHYDWTMDYQQVKNVSVEKTEHPCQVPVDLMRKVLGFIKTDLVIDPFSGSGTTLRAAKDLKRHAIGIEIEEKYCEIAARRMSQEVLI